MSILPNLLTLPLELWREISLYLEYRDLIRLGQTSKPLGEIFGESDPTGIWKWLYRRDLSDEPCLDQRYRHRYLEITQTEITHRLGQHRYVYAIEVKLADLAVEHGYEKLLDRCIPKIASSDHNINVIIRTALAGSKYKLAQRLLQLTKLECYESYECINLAVRITRPEIIEFMLTNGIDPPYLISSLLYSSARFNNIQMIDYAIHHVSNLIRTRDINLALSSAAKHGCLAAVNRLIPQATPPGLRRALRTAYLHHYTRICKRLLRAGATWFAEDAPDDPEDDDNPHAIDETDESDESDEEEDEEDEDNYAEEDDD